MTEEEPLTIETKQKALIAASKAFRKAMHNASSFYWEQALKVFPGHATDITAEEYEKAFLQSSFRYQKIPADAFQQLCNGMELPEYKTLRLHLLGSVIKSGRDDLAQILIDKGAHLENCVNLAIPHLSSYSCDLREASNMLSFYARHKDDQLKKSFAEACGKIEKLEALVETLTKRIEKLENPPVAKLDKFTPQRRLNP